MRFIHRKLTALAFVTFTLLASANLQACPVCFAAPDSPESRGMTLAILFLLGTIGIVLCGVASFVVYLMARQKDPLLSEEDFYMEKHSVNH